MGEILDGQDVSTTTSLPQRRVYWAGEQASSNSSSLSFREVTFQEFGSKPEKKRAALAHFDTIFGLDKVMVQLTIQTVLVSLTI